MLLEALQQGKIKIGNDPYSNALLLGIGAGILLENASFFLLDSPPLNKKEALAMSAGLIFFTCCISFAISDYSVKIPTVICLFSMALSVSGSSLLRGHQAARQARN